MNSLKTLLNKQKGELIIKKHKFDKKYDLESDVDYYLKDNGKIYAYNKEKIFFIGNYEVIGTVNNKTCYFRWGWLNPSIPNKSLNYSKNMIKYGEDKKIPLLLNPKLKGKEYGFKTLILASYVNSDYETYLVYKKPRSSLYVYLLIRNSKKPNISYKSFLKNELNIVNKLLK
tara:strand:+ start:70 stop:585 length:516 start_codon:yes stop_codon:yes gene_type:complete